MKIKEKILKLGKRKNCFIALLLCVLLAFTIISGLNGSKSGEIKANAQTAPQTKNLDLNGIRYTYQTSLNELKNEYKITNNFYTQKLFTISQDAEGIVYYSVGGQNSEIQLDQQQIDDIQSLTKNAITFYDKNNKIVENNDYTIDGTPQKTNNITFLYPTSFNLNDFNSINIDFNTLFKIPEINSEYFAINGGDYGNNGYVCTFLYLKNDIDGSNNNIDYLKENSIYYSVFLSKVTNEYNFNIKKYSGYDLKQIAVFFPDEQNTNDEIRMATPKEYKDFNNMDYLFENYVTINNLQFINTGYLNVIGAEVDYKPNNSSFTEFYKGNILLSTEKYDNDFLIALKGTLGATTFTQNIGAIFGGNFENNVLTNSIKYNTSNFIIGGSYGINVKKDYDNSTIFWYEPAVGIRNWIIHYNNQNQLLYLPEFETLRTTYNNQSYAALSAQVEDILYNVNYIGDIEEIEFNEKVEEDFQNLLKLTGLGAFIGLLLGLIFGNPALGAAIGAMWGALIALFPLLIDGLQALFGRNFLSGLYNFFKSITNFFANFVDTIINFLVSIITNPFVLILIVIVAIIFVITYFQKK